MIKEILLAVLPLKLGINWRNIEDTIKEVLFTEIFHSLSKGCQDLRLFTFPFKNMLNRNGSCSNMVGYMFLKMLPEAEPGMSPLWVQG